MKTTIGISDDLFVPTKHLAEREGTTMRALVEDGLRQALRTRGRRGKGPAFKLVTFRGTGLAERYSHPGGLHQAILESYEEREDRALGTERKP